MKLVVLGATGGTGLEIVKRGIERGHSVTALVRSPERLKAFQNQVTIKQGDLLNSSDLGNAIQGNDAVVSAFGPRVPISKADATLLQRFAIVLTNAMKQVKVNRVVVESVAFLFRNSIMPPAYLLGRLLFANLVADSSAMEGTICESQLQWTIVRPPQLTDKPYTGLYRLCEGRLPPFGFRISRADVAGLMVKSVENRSTIHKILGVSN